MRKLKKIFIALIIIVLICVSVFGYLISPVKNFSSETIEAQSTKELLASKLIGAAASMVANKNLDINVDISEQELESLLVNEAKGKDIHASIDNGEILFYINEKIFAFPAQYIIHSTLVESQGDLYLKINKIYVGKIQVPTSLFINKLKNKYPDLEVNEDNSIKISAAMPKALAIEGVSVEDKISIKMKFSVNSKLDLLELFLYLYPKNYKDLIK